MAGSKWLITSLPCVMSVLVCAGSRRVLVQLIGYAARVITFLDVFVQLVNANFGGCPFHQATHNGIDQRIDRLACFLGRLIYIGGYPRQDFRAEEYQQIR